MSSNDGTMRPLRRIVTLAAVVASALLERPLAADAATPTPEGRTRELYAAYDDDRSAQPGLDILTAQQRARWFSPRLVRMLQNDARCGDLRDLDYDPLVEGQDPAVSNVGVSAHHTSGGSQQVTVRFDNAGKPQRVSIAWVRTRDGWRIDEIEMNDGKRVTAVLAEPCEPFAPR